MTGDRLVREQNPRVDRLAEPRAGDTRLKEFLGFALDDEQFGLPLPSILEILKLLPVTEVPRAPQQVLGIISVRGRVTTVVDLRRRLRLPERPTSRHSRILIVKGSDEPYGLLVDQVTQVHRFLDEEIEPANTVAAGDLGDHVAGIGRAAATSPRGGRRSDGAAKIRKSNDQTLGLGHDAIVVLLDPTALLGR